MTSAWLLFCSRWAKNERIREGKFLDLSSPATVIRRRVVTALSGARWHRIPPQALTAKSAGRTLSMPLTTCQLGEKVLAHTRLAVNCLSCVPAQCSHRAKFSSTSPPASADQSMERAFRPRRTSIKHFQLPGPVNPRALRGHLTGSRRARTEEAHGCLAGGCAADCVPLAGRVLASCRADRSGVSRHSAFRRPDRCSGA